MVTLLLPGSLTEYYSPASAWVSDLETARDDGSGLTTQRTSRPRTFLRGRTHTESWNFGVFGPADPSAASLLYGGDAQVRRSGDRLTGWLPMFSDQDRNHVGWAQFDSATTRLYRNGEPFGDLAQLRGYIYVTLPPDEATYRWETSATHSVSDLSTRVEAAWTFRSQHVEGMEPEALPILGIKFTPRLDDHNRAPSGRRFTIPVHVGRQDGATYGILNDLSVEVSHDDGATWQQVSLRGSGDDRLADVHHTRRPGFVSLRASASDTAGNRVEQTIIHAYALNDLPSG